MAKIIKDIKAWFRGGVFKCLGIALNRMSPSLRADMMMRLISASVQHDAPDKSLRFLLELDNRIYGLEGNASMRYGNGIHTKHRHINYHQFFIKNISPSEHILDIGCGNGFLSYDMATNVEGVKVTGVELNEANIKFARKHYQHPNLEFIHGDALQDLLQKRFDVVVLSNVLEHIENRVAFLQKIINQILPKRLLIRVPVFERDWRVPLKKELRIDYRLDATHCIEYLQEEFFDEVRQAGMKITYSEFRWGEIWVVAVPNHQ